MLFQSQTGAAELPQFKPETPGFLSSLDPGAASNHFELHYFFVCLKSMSSPHPNLRLSSFVSQPGAAELPNFRPGEAMLLPSQPGAAKLNPQPGVSELPPPQPGDVELPPSSEFWNRI